MSRRYVPAGTATDGGDPLAIAPADAGWTYSGLRVIALAAGEARTIATGDSELFVLPLSATGLTVTVGGETFAGRRAQLGVRPRHRLRVRRARQRGHDHQRVGRRGRAAVGAVRPRPARPLRLGRRRRDRDPRRRPSHPSGHQLRQPRGVAARRQADVRRAAHARRQLVELPAAQARRLARVPGEQRGALLLPHRHAPAAPTTRPTASGCTARTPATAWRPSCGSTTT